MSERRYGDDEVREIFSLATTRDVREPSASTDPDTGGFTLADLQRIGAEVGLEPARVAQAAAALDHRVRVEPVRRSLGMPVGVTRVVDLPRAPTDREWEQLVTMCRTTFGARGVAAMTGGIREWSNGNLHIAVEPTATGQQLRLSTFKSDASAFNAVALFLGAIAILTGVVITAAGKPEKALVMAGMFGGLAVLGLTVNLVRLPGWARLRARQMDALAEHAVRLLSGS